MTTKAIVFSLCSSLSGFNFIFLFPYAFPFLSFLLISYLCG